MLALDALSVERSAISPDGAPKPESAKAMRMAGTALISVTVSSPRGEVRYGARKEAPGRAPQHEERDEVLSIRRIWGATPYRFKGYCFSAGSPATGFPSEAQPPCTASVRAAKSPRLLGGERRWNPPIGRLSHCWPNTCPPPWARHPLRLTPTGPDSLSESNALSDRCLLSTRVIFWLGG